MAKTSFLRDFARFQPRGSEWTVATRATLSAIIPLAALWGMDRLDWAMYATFGAMAALYGRNQILPNRLRMQLEAGVSLLVAILIGVCVGISPDRAWLVIPAAAVFATVTAVVAHRRNWHPGGVIFQVFAIGGVSSAPHTAADLVPALVVTTAAIALALLLTYLTSLSRHLWRRHVAKTPHSWPRKPWTDDVLPGHGPEWPWHHYVIRYGVGAAVAGVIATAIGIGHPYWAIVSAAVPLAAATPAGRTLRGVQRVIGTLGGVLVTWAVLSFDPSPLALIVLVGIAQAGAELFVGRNYGFALLFITPLALCMVQLNHPVPMPQLIADRAIETVLGVAVGLAITLLTRERKQRGDTD